MNEVNQEANVTFDEAVLEDGTFGERLVVQGEIPAEEEAVEGSVG